MCLGIPAKIISINEVMAEVQVGGVTREVSLMLCPEAKIGDYVLLHTGFAMEIISEADAAETLKLLEELGEAY